MQNYNEIALSGEEKIIYSLRSLYKASGYSQFKMSKFEEYDLYGKNKDFLINDAVITFTDAYGKLMALKPDVTFSIIKNCTDEIGRVKRVCYNENVYRMSEGDHEFTEIMQSGIECIGDIDTYNIYEVLSLAKQSLGIITDEYVLDMSHLGFVEGLISDIGDCDIDAVLKCIGEKNAHGLGELLGDRATKLQTLTGLYGSFDAVIPELEKLCVNKKCEDALAEIKALAELFEGEDGIKLDFSVISSVNYYNGIVFKGFVNGVPNAVLSGGRYDKLMKKLGKKSGAVGFAVYHDRLKYLDYKKEAQKKPVLVLYNENSNVKELIAQRDRLISEGIAFELQKNASDKQAYSDTIDLRAKE
ncbi:MAG: ATP phosphoribosyltransferase regulatory subunit [Clostridia bacterium]|nr:ATP phosphoribosyltransferase regulatory subunit [Clostridia bacterium]